jgi:hypothetical protein
LGLRRGKERLEFTDSRPQVTGLEASQRRQRDDRHQPSNPGGYAERRVGDRPDHDRDRAAADDAVDRADIMNRLALLPASSR